jgi:hypothetical protein
VPRQRDKKRDLRHVWLVRFLIATLLAFALALLPISGVAMAKAVDAAAMQTCHDMADHAPMPDHPKNHDQGSACAEHCMTQVSTPRATAAAGAPSIANAIAFGHALLIDNRAPRAADPPDTPPPRA